MPWTSFFTRVRWRTTWLRRATSRRRRSVSASGTHTSGRKSAARSEAKTPASILSVLIRAWAIAFTCKGLATITRATYGPSTRTTAMALPVASTTTLSSLVRLRPKPSRPERVISTRPCWRRRPSSQNTTSAKVRWISMPITRFMGLPSIPGHGSGGLHDNYGSALTAVDRDAINGRVAGAASY